MMSRRDKQLQLPVANNFIIYSTSERGGGMQQATINGASSKQ